MRFLILLTLVFSNCNLFCQNRNNIWCFGDSAGIDFSNPNNPVAITSSMDGRGSCVSIADSNGQLQFYAYTKYGSNHTTVIRSRNDSIMQNGDSIIGEAWYRELLIIPDPANSSLYYLFHSAVTAGGLFYSIVDLSANGGLGSVVQKNIQLLPGSVCDGLQGIKHGNGRDWWVVVRAWIVPEDNLYYSFLISPTGIGGPYLQNIGMECYNGFGNLNFNKTGNKAAFINFIDVLEIYDFDRCTGIFSNPVYIHEPWGFLPPYFNMWSCEFSPDGTKLFVSCHSDTSYLYQINLLDSDPWTNRDTIWSQDSILYTGGQLEIAPDGKIYLASVWYDGLNNPCPYPDSVYYPENMNLGIINYPDSLGGACNFQPYGFYLGGKRTYMGLPNNPNYDLSAWGGSICDTLGLPNNVQDNPDQNASQLKIFYHPDWQTVYVNASSLTGKYFRLRFFDLNGKLVYQDSGALSTAYFTKDISCSDWNKSMYLIRLETESEVLAGKFLVE